MSARKREQGAVLVEFALVIVLLLIILVGMMQFGIVLNAKIDETHLASSAARYAAVDQNPAGEGTLQDYIKERADTEDLRNRAQVCIEHPVNPETDTSEQVGDPVEVTISYTYDLLPLLGDRIGVATIDVQGNATMRLEALPEDVLAGCST